MPHTRPCGFSQRSNYPGVGLSVLLLWLLLLLLHLPLPTYNTLVCHIPGPAVFPKDRNIRVSDWQYYYYCYCYYCYTYPYLHITPVYTTYPALRFVPKVEISGCRIVSIITTAITTTATLTLTYT